MNKEIEIAAHHEVGHGIMAYGVGWTISLIKLDIENDNLVSAFTIYDYGSDDENKGVHLFKRIHCLMGGPVAEAIYRKIEINPGILEKDGEMINKLYSHHSKEDADLLIKEAFRNCEKFMQSAEVKKAKNEIVKVLLNDKIITNKELEKVMESYEITRIFNKTKSKSDKILKDTRPKIREEKRKSVLTRLFIPESITPLFEYILGLSSIFYITGYLSWAYYAKVNNLGYLPAIKEQYLVAGALPVLAALLLFALLKITLDGIYYIRQSKDEFIEKHRNKIKLAIIFIIGLVGIVANLSAQNNLSTLAGGKYLLPFTLLYGFYVTIGLTVPVTKIAGLKVIFPGLLVLIYSVLVIMYATTLFPKIPREYGGPQNVKVQLDIVRENVSPVTLALIADSTKRTSDSKVVRTNPLALIFDGGDFILLRQLDRPIDSDNALLKIKRDAIEGMYDCK